MKVKTVINPRPLGQFIVLQAFNALQEELSRFVWAVIISSVLSLRLTCSFINPMLMLPFANRVSKVMYSVMSVCQRGGLSLSLYRSPSFPSVQPYPLSTDMLKCLLVDVNVIVFHHITIYYWLLPLTTHQQQITNCPKSKLTQADLS